MQLQKSYLEQDYKTNSCIAAQAASLFLGTNQDAIFKAKRTTWICLFEIFHRGPQSFCQLWCAIGGNAWEGLPCHGLCPVEQPTPWGVPETFSVDILAFIEGLSVRKVFANLDYISAASKMFYCCFILPFLYTVIKLLQFLLLFLHF